MGFFDDLKKEISQAVNELVSDEELLPEEGNYDADSPKAAGEQSKEEEYFDEDDYIETEEDYADNTQQNMGVVIDDFASDEYVNTLDIDIKELIASYSNELGNKMQIPNNNVNEELQYDNTYNNMEAMNNFGFSNDMEQIYGDDDVMVNTLDDYLPEEGTSAEETFAEQDYGAEEPVVEEPISEEPVAEEPVSEEAVAEEPVSEEFVAEEPVVAEPVLEEPVSEEPVIEKPVTEKPEPEEAVAEEVKSEETVTEEPQPEETVLEESKEPVTEQIPVKEEPKKPVEKEVLPKQPVINKTIKKEVHQKTEEVDIDEPVIILKSQLKEKKEEDMKEEDMKEEVITPVESQKEAKQDNADYSDETAVITKGLAVKGDLIAEGSINVFGEVEGNITCKGKLMVSGTVYGNAEAGEFFANGAHITGNIVSKGSVKIGQGTIIIGNVTGTSAVIAGAVKGDIDVKGPVIVDATAIVMGDIKSKSVQINIGAAIEGRCSQCYADVSPTAFFKEN